MSKKKVLILGAGIYQAPLIKTAKDLGLFSIVVSCKGNYPGFFYADKIYYKDTTDIHGVLEVAKNEKINGICTSGTDVALEALGFVADSLGLIGVSAKSAISATNKLIMKRSFVQHGVRTANYELIHNIMEAKVAYKKLKNPIILKRVDSSGSRGVIKVSNQHNLELAFDEIMNQTKMGYLIAEEFLDGEEFGAQAFVYENKIKFIMPHGDMVFKGDAGVPIGHFVPYLKNDNILVDTKNQLGKAIKSLGVNNCAINADFILRDNKVYVLEIGARAGATCLVEMVSIYYGIDYYELMLRACLGDGFPQISSVGKTACAAEVICSEKEGIIKSIENNNPIASDIIDISFDYSDGDRINKFAVGPDRIGQVIVIGNNLETTLDRLNEVKKNIKFVLQ